MKKRNLILFGSFALISIALTVFTIFAWYMYMEKASNMQFDILQIDSLVTMYQANDENYNGIPNKLDSSNINKYYNPQEVEGSSVGYVSYSNLYHQENYSFNYVDQKYALSNDSSATLLNEVTLTNVAPSKVYGFKFEITNYVGRENTLDLTFDAENGINTTILSYFEARVGTVGVNGDVSFTNWMDFVNNGSYTGLTFYPQGVTIPATSTSIENKSINGRLDAWLQIRVKSDTTQAISSFSLPYFRVRLSVELDD